MKKALAILIVIVLALTLFACGDGNTNENSGGGTNTTPSGSTNTSPSGTNTSPSGGLDTAPSGSTGGEVGDPSVNANTIGFFMDDVDPYSRETYTIVWAYMRPMQLFLNIRDALVSMESVFNVKFIDYCANSDIDAMIQNIEIYADQGVDGYIIVIDASANQRIKEVLDGTGLPYIGVLNSVRDSSGAATVHLIGMEGITVGREMTSWLFDNYKTYWGEIDTSKLGLLNFTFSPNADFHDRYLGNEAFFKEKLPGNSNIFPADGVTGGLNEETGYDLAAALFAANPQVEYWFVPACLELYAQGAMRAAENLGIDDRVLIIATNSDVLAALWDSGYEGCFVACVASTAYQYGAPALSGLVSLMNGTSTFDSLWSGIRLPTDILTFYEIGYEVVTKDTYQDYFDFVRRESGLS